MSKFVYTTVAPRAMWLEDDYCTADRQTITVSVEDNLPVDTGLLDADGQKLWRVTKRERVGY